MTVGVVMLTHTALERAAQAARHWAAAGCPVVIHVDTNVPRQNYDAFVATLADVPHIRFSKRFRCEWGTWGLVAATQDAAQLMLAAFPEIRHVYLASGSCLPLRPVQELVDYLAARPRTDFIESATTKDVPWTIGGLEAERFTLRFPFSWRKNRFLFDRYVQMQRKLKVHRAIPHGLVPHMGSQWWCLSRQTLSAILQDPARATYDRYFRKVWIPDESYFQTLARLYSSDIESRSLTLSKFDYQGKPHIFYDDHLQLLRRSDCFVARKIWPKADRLYDVFLAADAGSLRRQEPNPSKIDRVFSKAVARRLHGRKGLHMQSRFPRADCAAAATAVPYSVFHGFAEVFEDFEPWLEKESGARVHGRLFAKDRAHFAHGDHEINGALSDCAELRDYDPGAFLRNLIWNTRGQHQCFQFGPSDVQAIAARIAKDANAQISVISGAWAVPLFQCNANFMDLREKAASLQKIESAHLKRLRASNTKARIRIWTLAEFIESPMEHLQTILDEIAPQTSHRLSEAPRMADLAGFGQFLQNLKNQGMHPYLAGDFPVETSRNKPPKPPRPYLVQ